MTFEELREMAQKSYPDKHPNSCHMLLVWLKNESDNGLNKFLSDSNINIHKFESLLEEQTETEMSNADNELIVEMLDYSNGKLLDGFHLLGAICSSSNHPVHKTLKQAGFDLVELEKNIKNKSHDHSLLGVLDLNRDQVKNPLLKYGRELTALAQKGNFDYLYDRPDQVNTMLDVLLRKQKCNIALTGPAGVGKTALVELFSRKTCRKEIPEFKDYKIYELSVVNLVAGTRYRGDFEERLNNVIRAFIKEQPALLFIDEMHLIWGAGRADGVITDAGNILKPYLARGEFKVIGATTVEEYQRYITKDQALARRFQEIRLNEPDHQVIFEMVKSQVRGLEDYHHIHISENMIHKAIELTDKHVVNRYQPDKSIDLIDSASVSAKKEHAELLLSDLLNTLARQTGRPVTALTDRDRQSLQNLEAAMKTFIIGQDKAIQKVAQTLIYRRLDIGADNRNTGTFLFAGPSSVGKTELARTIAKVFYGSEKKLLHIDLAEYSQASDKSKLIGASAGYIGSEKEGILTDWLHTENSGVILFDELEKAHSDIHDLLLGMMDEGRIRSALGKKLDTKECIIIMTTNILKKDDLNKLKVGFRETKEVDKSDPIDLLAGHFPHEFLTRYDEIIVFNSLTQENIKEILKLKLKDATERLRKKGIDLHYVDEQLVSHLYNKVLNNKCGARGINRIIEKELLQPISIALLYKEEQQDITITIDQHFYQEGKIQI